MDACNNLGFNYGNGHGVAKDLDRANALYKQACDGGNMRGCSNLGFNYDNGHGVAKDLDRANARLYKQACDGGNMRAASIWVSVTQMARASQRT